MMKLKSSVVLFMIGMNGFLNGGYSALPTESALSSSRYIWVETEITYEHWRLIWHQDHQVACDLLIEHQGWPTYGDVTYACGDVVLETWVSTPVCYSEDITQCQGLYLIYEGQYPVMEERWTEFPPPYFEVKLKGCDTVWGECELLPSLMFTAVEPIPGYEIESLIFLIDDQEINGCLGNHCEIDLTETTIEQGVQVKYAARSTFGDDPVFYDLRFRVVVNFKKGTYDVLVVGLDIEGEQPPCAVEWDVLPGLKDQGLPYAQRLTNYGLLATEHEYYLLQDYLSNASLNQPEYTVKSWQNKYDAPIFSAAENANIPARILKGLIAQESQFIPHSNHPDEFGLGMLTEEGVDMLFLWNVSCFLDFCISAYGESICASGYASLSVERQAYLRGLVIQQISTDDEFPLLANTISASCAQVGQLSKNVSGNILSGVATYNDFWAMTLANYYAGAGCMGEAMEEAWLNQGDLSWVNVTKHLDSGCELARDYVDNILFFGWPEEDKYSIEVW